MYFVSRQRGHHQPVLPQELTRQHGKKPTRKSSRVQHPRSTVTRPIDSAPHIRIVAFTYSCNEYKKKSRAWFISLSRKAAWLCFLIRLFERLRNTKIHDSSSRNHKNELQTNGANTTQQHASSPQWAQSTKKRGQHNTKQRPAGQHTYSQH